jgi:hypothetical protein
MYRRTKLAVTSFALLCLGVTQASTQTAKDLVGTWANVSNDNIRQDGTKVQLFGPRGTGFAIFERNGRYTVINLNPDVPKFASNNRAQGTDAENTSAVGGSIAHYGTYTYDAANKAITFKVEGSSYPNWSGETQLRKIITFTKNDLKWSVAASVGGTAEVGWKRVK